MIKSADDKTVVRESLIYRMEIAPGLLGAPLWLLRLPLFSYALQSAVLYPLKHPPH